MVVLAYYGWLLTIFTTQPTSTLYVPMSVVYVVVPVSALIALRSLGSLGRRIRRAAAGRRAMITLFLLMLALFAIAMPVAWSMAMASTVYMVLGPKIPLQAVIQRMIGGIDTFPLLAIPFFILAGNLMNTGGVTDRLVRFSKALVGHIRGGLAHVVVVTNMIMAGMSGSGIADAAGSGAVLIPAMQRAGYGVPFAAAVVAAAGTIGPIIPPSIPFVIYGSLANTSIGRLLLAGAVPGVLMGIMLMAYICVVARRRGYPAEMRASRRELAGGAPGHSAHGDADHHPGRHHRRRHDADGGGGGRRDVCLRARLLRLRRTAAPRPPQDSDRVGWERPPSPSSFRRPSR